MPSVGPCLLRSHSRIPPAASDSTTSLTVIDSSTALPARLQLATGALANATLRAELAGAARLVTAAFGPSSRATIASDARGERRLGRELPR